MIQKGWEAAPWPEKAAICRDAQAKFFLQHLAWWAPAFAVLLRRHAAGDYYPALAQALSCFIASERAILGIPSIDAPVEPQCEETPADEKDCCSGLPCGL